VDALLDCEISNGFGNRSRAVAASLPYTTGSMLAAAQEALRNGVGAISPSSGFHHAGYGHAGGFCSLNGIVIAAQNLPGVRVGLLDLDQHDPDGVREIVKHLGLDLPILHGRGTPRTAERWLQLLPAMVIETFIDCDVLLVQLGADPHINDELGGGWLDDDQLRRRDRAVFKTCRAVGLPVAWNLAGGYQYDADGTIKPVLDVHDNTLIECSEAWL
jgi:acetoin utilization deacetylase AcuC-like enzyme